MKKTIARFAADDSGATVIEYALIAALVAIGIISILQSVGVQLGAIFAAVAAGFK